MLRRWVRVLIVTVVVLAGLLVAADRLSARYAEDRAARQIQTSQDLSAAPSVDIKGFPFLTQVIGRRIGEVTVTADDVTTARGGSRTGLRISRLAADLHGVELSGGFRDFVADNATGTALVSYADVSAAAPAGAEVAYGGVNSSGQGQVKVTFTVPGFGWHRTVLSSVGLTRGDTVRLSAEDVPKTGIPVLDRLIRDNADFSRTLSGLPAGITLASVTAGPDGIRFTLTGRHVRLDH